MRALAELAGLSTNAISKTERGTSSPTVSSLQQIATALDVPLLDFFQESQDHRTIFTAREDRRRSYITGGILESLGAGLANQHLEPFLVILEPGAGSAGGSYRHSGEEFALCMRGEIEHRVGDHVYQLRRGDSLLFDPQQLHGAWNNSHSRGELLLVLQEASPEERARARQTHQDI